MFDKSILKVGPSLYDIINLPPGKLVVYMIGATTVGFVYNIAITRSFRWARKKLGNSSDFEIRDESSHPRLLLSSLAQSMLLYGGSFLFEHLYIKSPLLPKVVSGIVFAMRRCVGLPGKAPYGELSGGSPVANVLASTYDIERVFCSLLPIPSVGTLGINVVPLTTEQAAEVFAPLSGNPDGLELRFITPTRMVRVACQVGFASAIVGLVRKFLIPKIVGAPNQLRQPSSLPTVFAVPATLMGALAIVRDAESISFLGTRWRLNLVSTSLLLLLPTCVLMELIFAKLNTPPIIEDEEVVALVAEIRDEIMAGIPIQHMSRQEVSMVQESLFGSLMRSVYFGDTAAFVGGLAALTTVIVTMNTVHAEPLTAYESSLERINADIADEVLERQASIDSVADETTETCPICLRAERPVSQDMLRIKACGHEFHTECLASWLDQSTECPLCRSHIDRQLTPAAQRDLQRWLSMPDEMKEAYLGVRCVDGANFIYDALSLDVVDKENNARSSSFYMGSIDEIVKIIEGCQTLNLDKKTTLLLTTMGEVLTDALQSYSSPLLSTVEDMLCMMMAPCSPDPLFSAAFILKSHIESLVPAKSLISQVTRQVLIWTHFHL